MYLHKSGCANLFLNAAHCNDCRSWQLKKQSHAVDSHTGQEVQKDYVTNYIQLKLSREHAQKTTHSLLHMQQIGFSAVFIFVFSSKLVFLFFAIKNQPIKLLEIGKKNIFYL